MKKICLSILFIGELKFWGKKRKLSERDVYIFVRFLMIGKIGKKFISKEFR